MGGKQSARCHAMTRTEFQVWDEMGRTLHVAVDAVGCRGSSRAEPAPSPLASSPDGGARSEIYVFRWLGTRNRAVDAARRRGIDWRGRFRSFNTCDRDGPAPR
ncbi:B1065G12.19 [Oryza sativa Japonica Group]|uniref:B1065G12.19 protein n=1 Tax=Oryza sativa subsp. japonica TaxID=39947 RepID=Q8RZ76_ORYSJ|nr:B1065G12.19 [Oryza sativa Japonica Group]BAD82779.1 hypothetical protein [Oryza sativa Japonica Group]